MFSSSLFSALFPLIAVSPPYLPLVFRATLSLFSGSLIIVKEPVSRPPVEKYFCSRGGGSRDRSCRASVRDKSRDSAKREREERGGVYILKSYLRYACAPRRCDFSIDMFFDYFQGNFILAEFSLSVPLQDIILKVGKSP